MMITTVFDGNQQLNTPVLLLFAGKEDRRQHRVCELQAQTACNLRLHHERGTETTDRQGNIVRERHIQRRNRPGIVVDCDLPQMKIRYGVPFADICCNYFMHTVWVGEHPVRRRRAERVRAVPWKVLI